MAEEYKCDICGAPATVHLTQIVDGKIRKAHLCEKCAAKSKVAELPIMKFTELLAKTLASGGKKDEKPGDSAEATTCRAAGKVCPACGTSAFDFGKKQLLGCPHCYETFAEEISAMMPAFQRGRDYRGDAGTRKKPGKSAAEAAGKDSAAGTLPLDELKARLKKAVALEDYALAARLRDEIRSRESAKKSPAVPAAKKSPAAKKKPAASASAKKSAPAAKRSSAKKDRGGDSES